MACRVRRREALEGRSGLVRPQHLHFRVFGVASGAQIDVEITAEAGAGRVRGVLHLTANVVQDALVERIVDDGAVSEELRFDLRRIRTDGPEVIGAYRAGRILAHERVLVRGRVVRRDADHDWFGAVVRFCNDARSSTHEEDEHEQKQCLRTTPKHSGEECTFVYKSIVLNSY